MSASALPRPAFRELEISVGLVAPVRRTAGAEIDFAGQVDLAAAADALGFAALWVGDVPLNGSWYPEAFGHLDPFVALGADPPPPERRR